MIDWILGIHLSPTVAWEFSKEKGLDLVTIHPPFVIGPFISPSSSVGAKISLALLTGTSEKSLTWLATLIVTIVIMPRSLHIHTLWHILHVIYIYRRWTQLCALDSRTSCACRGPVQCSYIPVWASRGKGTIHLLRSLFWDHRAC